MVKSAKSCFWRSFNICTSDFGQLSYVNHCLKSTVVESMCVDWRKSFRSLWHVDPRTHCDLIITVSNQIPLILSQNLKIFIYIYKFIPYV